jgi:outer membrane protein TolC
MRHYGAFRRRASTGWCVGWLLVLAGCHSIRPAEVLLESSTQPEIIRAAYPAVPNKNVPISLDTVFRLAQDQNGQVRIARMKLDDAEVDRDSANKHWLPDLSVGMGTWRHDGGIQDFQGNLLRSDYSSALGGVEVTGKYDWKEILLRRVEAERRLWQQKGELSKLTSENLLDAATTYVSLVAARSGIAISIETEARLKDLLDQTTKLAKIDSGLNVEVSRIETELMAQSVLTVKLREISKASAAKLAYLIGLDPCCDFTIADGKLVPIYLVDAKQPVQALVDQALDHGPGVRELEGLLRAVEAARNSNYGLTHWMPSVEVNLVEGGFGAAPNGTPYAWANRFDAGIHVRWSLSEFVYSKQRRQQADANIMQVRVSIDDLRSKLTLGVQEAREAVHSGAEQIDLAKKHINYAEDSYRLSKQRLEQNIKGRSPSEVLLALRTLGGARLEYLQAVRDHNRAQLRLFVLVGASEAEMAHYEHREIRRDRPRHLPPP